MTLQSQLIQEAKKRVYNATSLARELGIPKRNVQRVFRGDSFPSHILEAIAKKFKVKLIFGNKSMKN